MKRYADYIIDTWVQSSVDDSNGTAKVGSDGESIWLEVYSDDETFKTTIDVRDILQAIAEII